MLAGKGVSGRVRLMFWASLHGAASEQMPPPTRTMTWHGMLYGMVYSILHVIWHGICVSPLPGAGSDGLPPPTRTMAWHGMLYGMVNDKMTR